MAAQCLSAASIVPSNPKTCSRNSAESSVLLNGFPRMFNLGSSFRGTKLTVECRRPARFFVRKRCSTVATVLFSLPTAKPERESSEKLPKWSARAIKSFAMAELEARKLKYPNTGTEALLMGILVEGTSLAAKFLRANGITLFKVREETVNLLGKSDMYFFSPEHPPLTEPAQRALDWAIDAKLKSDQFSRVGHPCIVVVVLKDGRTSGEDGEINPSHTLLGIWSEKESAGHKILSFMGFTDEKVEELAKSMDKDVRLSYK